MKPKRIDHRPTMRAIVAELARVREELVALKLSQRGLRDMAGGIISQQRELRLEVERQMRATRVQVANRDAAVAKLAPTVPSQKPVSAIGRTGPWHGLWPEPKG